MTTMIIDASVPDAGLRDRVKWHIHVSPNGTASLSNESETEVIHGLTKASAARLASAHDDFVEALMAELNRSYSHLHDPERWTAEDWKGDFVAFNRTSGRQGHRYTATDKSPGKAARRLMSDHANVHTVSVKAVATGRIRHDLYERIIK